MYENDDPILYYTCATTLSIEEKLCNVFTKGNEPTIGRNKCPFDIIHRRVSVLGFNFLMMGRREKGENKVWGLVCPHFYFYRLLMQVIGIYIFLRTRVQTETGQ